MNENAPKKGQRGFQRTHGLRRSPEYISWHHLKDRCRNPNNPAFGSYGGRGITMDPRWEVFENFFYDMGPKPPGTSIDRRDNNQGYCKENCRWATQTEQVRNRSNTRRYGAFGRWLTLAEWSEELGVHPNTLQTRIRNGWEVSRALSTPALLRGQRRLKEAA